MNRKEYIIEKIEKLNIENSKELGYCNAIQIDTYFGKSGTIPISYEAIIKIKEILINDIIEETE